MHRRSTSAEYERDCRLGEQLGWQLFRSAVNRLRGHWQLAPPPLWGGIGALYRRRVPFICGFSAHVVPRPPDWGPQIHLTGWWLLVALPGDKATAM